MLSRLWKDWRPDVVPLHRRRSMKKRMAIVHCLMLVYLLSGACSLIDQVVWVRLLKLSLGNTVYASSIVVSVFMGGLALGALLMGRYCDRVRRPLRLYSILEVLITVTAVSSPWTLKLADQLYVWFYRTWQPSHGLLLILQVLVSAAILLVPTVLMGSTLPLLSRFVTSIEKETGRQVGRLYALNTLGAAAGCFLAGFVLIRSIGVMATLYTAAVLNLLVAAGGWSLHVVSGGSEAFGVSGVSGVSGGVTIASDPETAQPLPPPQGTRLVTTRFLLLILAFFLSGLLSISYELLWMRSVVFSMGAFTYVFSAILTVYLVGNVIGTVIGTAVVRRLGNPGAGFAGTLLLLGIFGVLYTPWLHLYTHDLLPVVKDWLNTYCRERGISSHLIAPLLQNALLFLVPSIIMGIGFPIMLQAWVDHAHRIGWSTGMGYGTNTIGAVTGGVLTGFVLIPGLGLHKSIILLGLVGVWVASVVWYWFLDRQKFLVRVMLPVLAGLITVVGLTIPAHLYDRVVARNPYSRGRNLVAVKEGVTTTVSLHENPKTGDLFLCTSGQLVAGDARRFRGDQKMLGHFGVLLNKRAQSVLSVGFGSGESTACLSYHGIRRIDCVEIAPELVEFSIRYFSDINLGDQLHQKVNMVIMDAKNFLHLSETRYDAIVNDCTSMRYFAENASLYTKEYFESARKRLNDGGLFLSWMDAYAVEAAPVLNSIMGTMMEVFPYVTLWYLTPEPDTYFTIVGSEKPQFVSLKHVKQELARPRVKRSLGEINIFDSIDVMTCYMGDEQDLKRHIREYQTNSDFTPYVEFFTGNIPAGMAELRRFLQTVRSGSAVRHVDWTGMSPGEQREWIEQFEQAYRVSDHILLAKSSRTYFERLQHCVDGLRLMPDNRTLIHTKRGAESALLTGGMEDIGQGAIGQAGAVVKTILQVDPESATAWILRSQIERAKGRTAEAEKLARQALQLAPDSADPYFNLGTILYSAGRVDGAAVMYEAARKRAGEYFDPTIWGDPLKLGFQ